MAPFNTHFLVAEKIWPELSGPWQPYYGQFCFGCVAPDVDKVSATLSQKETHFFDRTGDYELMVTHRTVTFLKSQIAFLGRPFADLGPEAQAFSLGYLCHLCVDEVSKHLWRRATWLSFNGVHPGAAFAALDEASWHKIQQYRVIADAICSLRLFDFSPRIPFRDLERIYQGTCRFVRATTVEEEYLALVDMFDRPNPERRDQKLEQFRAEIDLARRQVHLFEPDILVKASLAHSRQRLADLITGRLPEPGYPKLRG